MSDLKKQLEEKKQLLTDEVGKIDGEINSIHLQVQQLDQALGQLHEERAEKIGGIKTVTELIEQIKD